MVGLLESVGRIFSAPAGSIAEVFRVMTTGRVHVDELHYQCKTWTSQLSMIQGLSFAVQ